MASKQPAVVVVGSLNVDLVVAVERLPAPGETVLGGDVTRVSGGKGANQAVAARRLGQSVAMVGAVGADEAGEWLRTALTTDGVDVARVRVVDGTPTGHALITVDRHGENTIVVSPGANGRVGRSDVEAAADLLTAAAVTLLQLEIPLDAVQAAAAGSGGTVILNPAPAQALPDDLVRHVDVLVPNRTELALLAAAPVPATTAEVAELAARLPVPDVVVTLGSDGALVVRRDAPPQHIPARPVDPVDTTAAGDSFCGALADALARGADLVAAAEWAAAAAALTTTVAGAQPSLPSRPDVLRLVGT